ncbi:MAG: tetratricopeptide repeat protein [Rhodobacteraceae bacterium]|nr:tetratricopeptide repeat protein [Paracoccaceae bacterium]
MRSLHAAAGIAMMMALGSCGLSGDQPVGYQAQIAVAEQMLQSGQFDRGYRILDDVTRQQSSSGPAQLALGDAYLRSRAYLKAELAYRRASETGKNVDGQIGLGRVALARNEAQAARQHFQGVLARNPRSLAALNGMGVAYDLEGNHLMAAAEYRKALAIDPGYNPALNNLGLSLALAGNGAEAAQVLSEVAASQVNDAVLRQNLAVAYFVAGREQDGRRLATTDISGQRADLLRNAVLRYRRARS